MNHPLIYQYIGKRIRQERERQGMSQEVLGLLVNMVRPSITNIEGGRQRLPLHTLYAIAGVLKVPVQELLPDTQPDHYADLVRPSSVRVKELKP